VLGTKCYVVVVVVVVHSTKNKKTPMIFMEKDTRILNKTKRK
jgi:hypothetical protein